jgi:hypothetical protein
LRGHAPLKRDRKKHAEAPLAASVSKRIAQDRRDVLAAGKVFAPHAEDRSAIGEGPGGDLVSRAPATGCRQFIG